MDELTTLIGASYDQRVGGQKSFRPYENQSGAESSVRTCKNRKNREHRNRCPRIEKFFDILK